MKRRLQLKKETLRALSAEHLEQVAGGSNGSIDSCDGLAPNVLGGLGTRPIYPLPINPFGKL